jgi:hypothetical protein
MPSTWHLPTKPPQQRSRWEIAAPLVELQTIGMRPHRSHLTFCLKTWMPFLLELILDPEQQYNDE